MTLVSPIYHSRQRKKQRTAAEIFHLTRKRHPSQSERRAWRVVKALGFARYQFPFGYPVQFVHRPKRIIIEIGNRMSLSKRNRFRQAGYNILWFDWDRNYRFEIPYDLNIEGFFRHKGNAGYGNTVQKSVSPSQPQCAIRQNAYNITKPD